ncbi:magnesium transporter [Actinocrispum wychmicini]|uniref:Magnesium transporter n=1 Tax=Actinocrispum wychmicini TaxID=1213861 RepID=A0A4R2IZD8_9PSEU|nr:magnesium transporter [Actinocrispum wychmicini]
MPVSAYVVDCAVYVGGERLPGRWSHDAAIEEVRRRGDGFVWVGLYEPDLEHMQVVAETFDLHPLAVEDAVCAHQRPKLERYDHTLFMVLKTVHYVAHESPATTNEIVETGEIMAFLGTDFIVTVRHGSHSGLHELRRGLEGRPERLALGPAAVLHAIADQVVDSYLAVTEAFGQDIEQMESVIFEPRSEVGAEQIYMMKREILELRNAVSPLVTPLRRLAEADGLKQVRPYFQDVDDHLTAVSERVTAFDELLTSLVNAALAKISLQQNTDMRKISAWVAIIAVPTMVFGLYGMNFDFMPETHWQFSYPAVILLVLAACFLLYRVFKRNQWL